MSQPVYVTAEGLEKIKAEVQQRIDVKRVEIADRLDKAIKMGDLKENADYHVAKEDQAFNEGRIQQLQDQVMRAEIIKDTGRKDRVTIGSTVLIAEVGFEDEPETYQIVGASEADPIEGRISNESPIGSALLGAKVGAEVRAATPNGTMIFKVIEIK